MKTLIKKLIAITLILSLVLASTASAFAFSFSKKDKKDRGTLIFMGDSMSYNYPARHNYAADLENSFAYIVADELGYTVLGHLEEEKGQGWEPFSFGGGRTTDLYASISDTYGGDDYSKQNYRSDFVNEHKGEWLSLRRDAVEEASAVIIQLGYSNLAVFVLENLLSQFDVSVFGSENEHYDTDLKQLLDDADQEKYEAVLASITEKIKSEMGDDTFSALVGFIKEISNTIDDNKVLNIANDLVASFNYAVISELVHFDKLIKEIKEINPDVEIYVMGLSNPADVSISFDFLGKNYKIPLYKMVGDIFDGFNNYMKYLSPVRCQYTYVEPAEGFETYGNLMGRVGQKYAGRVTRDLISNMFASTLGYEAEKDPDDKTALVEGQKYADKLYVGAMHVAKQTDINLTKALLFTDLEDMVNDFKILMADDQTTMAFLEKALATDIFGNLTSKKYEQYIAHLYLMVSLSSLYSHPTQAGHNAMAKQLIKAMR